MNPATHLQHRRTRRRGKVQRSCFNFSLRLQNLLQFAKTFDFCQVLKYIILSVSHFIRLPLASIVAFLSTWKSKQDHGIFELPVGTYPSTRGPGRSLGGAGMNSSFLSEIEQIWNLMHPNKLYGLGEGFFSSVIMAFLHLDCTKFLEKGDFSTWLLFDSLEHDVRSKMASLRHSPQ